MNIFIFEIARQFKWLVPKTLMENLNKLACFKDWLYNFHLLSACNWMKNYESLHVFKCTIMIASEYRSYYNVNSSTCNEYFAFWMRYTLKVTDAKTLMEMHNRLARFQWLLIYFIVRHSQNWMYNGISVIVFKCDHHQCL